MLDFSVSKETLESIRSVSKKVLILNHHKSAYQELKIIDGCFIDLSRSGAVLSWLYFHENKIDIIPTFFLYIEDRDLWNWNYREKSEPVYYGLKSRHVGPFSDFRFYEQYLESEKLKGLISFGSELLLLSKKYILEKASLSTREKLILKSGSYFSKEISEYDVMLLELPSYDLISEISEYLYTTNDVDFTICYFKKLSDYCISLRTNNENIDVSEIAKAYFNGGGHKNAAGGKLSYDPKKLFDKNQKVGVFC